MFTLRTIEDKYFIQTSYMKKNEVIKSIRELSQQIMPVGAQVFLFGSQARNDDHIDSDWDILILLNKKEKANNQDFDDVAFPLVELGWKIGAMINPVVYSKNDWEKRDFTPFYKNVKQDGILLWD